MKTIFLIRHGEPALSANDTDPPLREEGRQRARTLAKMLEVADVRQIFVSSLRRTQETAEPLATALSLTPQQEDISAKVAAAIAALPEAGSVLVVGHTNTVPQMIEQLGGPALTLGNVFDNLFVLTRDAAGAAHLVTLRYGVPTP